MLPKSISFLMLPKSISFFWNNRSSLRLVLRSQFFTRVFLTFHFTYSFSRLIFYTRNVFIGFKLRFLLTEPLFSCFLSFYITFAEYIFYLSIKSDYECLDVFCSSSPWARPFWGMSCHTVKYPTEGLRLL